jgi:DNA-directed RNA polymerase subunit L
MNTKKDTTIKIRITSQEKNELKATAHKQQKTMSNILREAIVKNNEIQRKNNEKP